MDPLTASVDAAGLLSGAQALKSLIESNSGKSRITRQEFESLVEHVDALTEALVEVAYRALAAESLAVGSVEALTAVGGRGGLLGEEAHKLADRARRAEGYRTAAKDARAERE